ncbi:type VI secretion system Vgr family protein [Desulfovibrio fairfieldensis]|uniref:type VI secretion system Vgr family protein n=1 Tax=Desulfovibrio fairfieldensis TaxID=44742 RepID=UPI000ACA4EE1|nr:type VI secretion system tip protein TssI/VgrG [Desulfovibrio fairfieldensis]
MTQMPAANASWFNFTAQSGDFGVYAFSGFEEVCKPYEFSIELVSRSANVDLTALLGTPACLSIADRSGGERLVHGLIREMEQLHTANRFTHYRCSLVPRLWFLGQIRDHRIFQNLSVVEIIQQILKEQGFTGDAASFKLCYAYEPREYCVQYGETDLHFITRLCEEEGIYFYFEHKADAHCLCLCDREGGPKIPGQSDLRFFPGSGQRPDTAVINRLALHESVNSNAAAYREWNFRKPRLDLEVSDHESEQDKAPAPPGMLLEQYAYPHLYQLRKPGERYAKLRLSRQLTFRQWIDCTSDVARFLPSYVFSIDDHPREALNARWWVVAVRHEGRQPGVLEHEAPDGRGLHYASRVTAIPEMTRFIPAPEHPKNLILDKQTAHVTGPKGEEIHPDKYGRVKVQFHWDREGQYNEKTSCWVRASQEWAGGKYGTMAIPRIGHEVVVSFLEGDPDRPLITGRVYHELNMPPYELPAHKTRTVFKSMSTPGAEGEARGFNEFRVEDKKGREEIYAHAEKDVNAHVKNDWKEHILHDRHRTVDNFTYALTRGETHETLKQPRKTELFANDNRTVHADSHTQVDGKWLGKAGTEIHLEGGLKIVLEAGAELTLKAGGSWLTINGAGVSADGAAVCLNSGGGPGDGTPADPLLPEGSVVPDVPPPPKAGCLGVAAQNKKALCLQGE